MVQFLTVDDAIKVAIAHGVDRRTIKRGLDHLQLDMAYGDEQIKELLVTGKFEELVRKHKGVSGLAAACGRALHCIPDANKHCVNARVDVSERDDGVCDRHDFGALCGLGGGA